MLFSAPRLVVALLAAAVIVPGADASAFLSKEQGARAAPRTDILEVLEEELGSGHGRADEARVAALQDELGHTFASLPKNRHGNLQAAGARYALHRLFVQRHAWQLTGLEPGGQGWSNSSAADALGDRVPERVRTLFRERLSEEGVGLRELAVLAALLESMVHAETDDRLRVSLRALGRREEDALDEDKATSVLHAYMASYVLGAPLAELSPQSVREHARSVEKAYPTWPDTQIFLNGVRDSVANGAASYDFRLMSDILERVGDQYGRWQSRECSALKSTLAGLESRVGSGRVPLSAFYGSALSGENWQFSESVDYLRQLGALDESSGGEPSVIIPNYVYSPSNCVASSGYYAVCCVDECEELMDHLELQLQAPTASVDDIARIVSGLPSESIAANRTLPQALLRRLDEVAAYHGGEVPLHGRLFAQWMHYAYPRECPFPHVTGTISPLRAEDFAAKTGSKVVASKEEMRHFAAASPSRRQAAAEEPEGGLCSNMWTMEEELVDPSAHESHQGTAKTEVGRRGAEVTREVMLCLAVLSVVLTLGKSAMSLLKVSQEQDLLSKGGAAASVAESGSPTYAI